MKIRSILLEYRWKFLLTLILILLESGISILFPLFIGFAIDSAIQGSVAGSLQLGILGLLALAIGAGRRFFDTRLYAMVFKKFGEQLISKIDNGPSVKTARLGMLREVIEFLENSFPEIVQSFIAFFGVISILAALNLNVFIGSLIVSILIFSIYLLSSKQTIKFNKNYNEAIEGQVDIIHSNLSKEINQHLSDLMKWNIKLSDLETINFSLSWLVLMLFLVSSILIAVHDGLLQYGVLFSLVMYVFQFIESVAGLPLFYQQWLRLTEIRERLERLN